MYEEQSAFGRYAPCVALAGAHAERTAAAGDQDLGGAGRGDALHGAAALPRQRLEQHLGPGRAQRLELHAATSTS